MTSGAPNGKFAAERMAPAVRDPALAALSREEAARRRSSPRVRRLATERGVALGDLVGTGFGGRVRPGDLMAFIEARGVAAPAGHAPAPTAIRLAHAERPAGARPVIPSEPAPAELLVFEIDATAAVRWRAQRAAAFRRRFGVELSELALVVWAAASALSAEPSVNVTWDAASRAARPASGVNIAMAAAGGAANGDAAFALVLRDADRLSLVGVACAVDELVRRSDARDVGPGSAAALLVEHGGASPALSAAPLLVSPHAARLTTTASERRLVVRTDVAGEDYVAIRSVLRASLGYDAHLIDAVTAARYFHAFRRAIEAIGVRSAIT